MIMTYREVYDEGSACLEKAGILEAALDARLLLEYICGTNQNTLFAHPDKEVSDKEYKQYIEMIRKRSEHIPLQHLTGTCEFMGLEFSVNGDVLIPRQDTEFLVEEAMRYIDSGARVLDLCTGSGCIISSLAYYKPGIEAVASDISEKALAVAVNNAKNLDVQVSFVQGDLYNALDNYLNPNIKFDVIVSNPPYIKRAVIDGLMPEVKDYDPFIALCGGDDGLDFYRTIISKAPIYMTNYGRIFLEIGYDQADAVNELLIKNGFTEVEVLNDYAGNPRVAKGLYKGHL